MKISAVIIAYNEERYIGACLASLREVADEILVLDSFSTDRTEEICRSLDARFEQHTFDGYVSQKNRAVQMARHPWILSLDADEALSDELTASLKALSARIDDEEVGASVAWKFNRRNSFCGQWMKHTSWYPDRKIRLFHRNYGQWTGYDPHDRVEILDKHSVSWLEGDLLHWATDSVEEFRNKMDHFARITARAYHNSGKKSPFLAGFGHGLWRWIREYVLKSGFLDGRAGWNIARYSAMNACRKYRYLRQLNKGYDI